MRFEVRGLIRDHGVAGRVAFVESVRRKLFKLLEDLFGDLLRHAVLDRAGNELFAHLFHELGDFFAHGFAQRVSLAARKAGHVFGHLHHLFLIHGNAVRIFKRALQERMRIRNIFFAVLAFDE